MRTISLVYAIIFLGVLAQAVKTDRKFQKLVQTRSATPTLLRSEIDQDERPVKQDDSRPKKNKDSGDSTQ